jgi:hypothetical protein
MRAGLAGLMNVNRKLSHILSSIKKFPLLTIYIGANAMPEFCSQTTYVVSALLIKSYDIFPFDLSTSKHLDRKDTHVIF